MPNKEKLENINWEIDNILRELGEAVENLYSIYSTIDGYKEALSDLNKMLLEE